MQSAQKCISFGLLRSDFMFFIEIKLIHSKFQVNSSNSQFLKVMLHLSSVRLSAKELMLLKYGAGEYS